MKSSSIARRPPGPLVLGLGCERGTPIDEVIALAEKALAQAGADKADTRLRRLARREARRSRRSTLPPSTLPWPHASSMRRRLKPKRPGCKIPRRLSLPIPAATVLPRAPLLSAPARQACCSVAKLTSSHATAAIAGPADHRLAIMPATLWPHHELFLGSRFGKDMQDISNNYAEFL